MASWKAFAGLLIGAALAAGCGGGGDPESTDTADSAPAASDPAGHAAPAAAPPQAAGGVPGGPPAGGHGGPPAGGPAEMQTAGMHGAPAQAGGHGGPPSGFPGGPPPGYGPDSMASAGHGAPGASGPPQMGRGQGPPGGYPGYPGGPPGSSGSNPSTASSSNPLQNLFGGIDGTIKGEAPSETPIAGMPSAPGTYPSGYPGAAAPGGHGAGNSGPPGGHGAAGAGNPGFPGLAANAGAPGGHGAGGAGQMPAGFPGAPDGYPGGPEGTEGAPGQGQVPSYDEGTPEYAVQKLVIQVAKGDLTGLDEVISARATGVLAQLREGDVPEEKLETLKTQMGRVKLLNRRPDGSGYDIFLQNDQNEVLHFTCRREGEDYLVKDFNVREAPRRRARR